MENYITGTGQRLLVHEEKNCDGQGCCIHSPSNHHMKGWPTNWRHDRYMMERICPHGIGHPDPDCTAFQKRSYMGGRHPDHIDTTHGCDGCCICT